MNRGAGGQHSSWYTFLPASKHMSSKILRLQDVDPMPSHSRVHFICTRRIMNV